MDGAPHQEWPVHRLAKVCAVSPTYFARSFKDALAVPPRRYLPARRIERAVALLRETDLPITDMAFQAGWKSLCTLRGPRRDFKPRTGAKKRPAEAGRFHDLQLKLS